VRSWVGAAARVSAGAIWLVAGFAKATDFTSFENQVRGYDMVPSAVAPWVAYGLPLLEIALGAYLVAGLLVRPAAWLSIALLGILIAAQVQAWARGLTIDCGCFGALDRQQVGFGTVVRDLLLAVPTLLVLTLGGGRLSVDARLAGTRARYDP
jgi:uncharacterized membrane protein YphA (DoxX/SURF4 family)